MEISSLEEKLYSDPIKLPTNPFMDVFKRFGRDEFASGIVNLTATGIADYIFGFGMSKVARDVGLSLIGPVMEKIGLFSFYFKDALELYRTTPEKERKNVLNYFSDAIKAGMPTLIEDVTVHDPIYAVLMYASLQTYPQSPAWMLSAVSFIAAVIAVSGIETGVSEARYLLFKHKLKRAGFNIERYFEARFYIRADKNPLSLLLELKNEFALGEIDEWQYCDRYFNNRIPSYSGRRPYFRIRQRVNAAGDSIRTAQIVFKRERDIGKKDDWHRYFPTRKEKIYYILDGGIHSWPEEIADPDVRRILAKCIKEGDTEEVSFFRRYARSPELYVSTDNILSGSGFYVVELKTYSHVQILKEAMRRVMIEYPVIPTVHGKQYLIRING